jgi:hypothetical protein
MKFFKMTMMAMTTLGAIGAAHAQQNPSSGEGVLTPPPEVSNVISIDAHNTILIETQDPQDPDSPKEYSLAIPRHIYSGGVARLLGGSIITTEMLVVPQSAMRSGNGAFGNNGASGVGNFGGNSANNSFNNSGGNGNFGNNFGGNSSISSNNSFNRGFSNFVPRISVNNMQQFNQILSYLDKPIRQVEVGTDFSDGADTADTAHGAAFSRR